MATCIDDLYEADFFAWTRRQAAALRTLRDTRPNAEIDWRHLIEEVRSLGKSERDAVRSHLCTVMEHLLKLQHSPATLPRAGWRSPVARTRVALRRVMSSSLRRDARRRLPELYHDARGLAVFALAEHGEETSAASLPTTCPYTLDQLTDPDWWPEERGA